MTQLAADNFTRSDQSGWGTASDGLNIWTPQFTADPPTIESNLGVMTSTNAGFDSVMHCGSNTTIAIDLKAEIKIIAAQNAGLVWAIKDNGSYYRTVVQNGVFYLQRSDSFSFTTLASTSLTGWSSADFWWQHATMDASGNLTASAWKDGTSEPGSPMLTATDTTYTDLARGFGITSVGSGDGSKNYFAAFQVTDGASIVTSERTVQGEGVLLRTSTRQTQSEAVLVKTFEHNVSGEGVILSTRQRTVSGRGVISGIAHTPPPNATLIVRSGSATAIIRSGSATAIIRS